MVSFLRTLLVVLLALPAIALPPGVTLEWCLCRSVVCDCSDLDDRPDAEDEVTDPCCGEPWAATEGSCCNGAPEAPSDDRSEGGTLDSASCPCCHSVDVGHLEPGVESAGTSQGIAPPVALQLRVDPPVRTLSRMGRFVANRAPPGAVRPAGLLPGTQPLLR